MRDFNSESQSVYDGFGSGLFWKGVWLWIATKSNSESQSVYDRFGSGLLERGVAMDCHKRYIPPPHVKEFILNLRVLISDVLKSI
jgi:hypothetical protein